MLPALRMVLVGIAALAVLDAVLVTASLFMTDRAPVSPEYFGISFAVTIFFLVFGGLALAIQRQMGRLSAAGLGLAEPARAAIERNFRPLVGQFLLAGLLFGFLLAAVSYGILARIDQDFAVFG